MKTLEADAARQAVAQKFQTVAQKFQTVAQKFQALAPFLDERQRRPWAATEARALGHGGIALVSAATGLSRPTLESGLSELAQPDPLPPGQVRASGGRCAPPGEGVSP